MQKQHKTIPQEDAYGCGLACVAVVVGKPYRTVAKHVPNIYMHVQERGMYCQDIVDALAQFGILSHWEKITKQNTQKIDTIGTIVYMKKEDHYVVRVKNGWHDSWINWPSMNPVKAGIIKQLPEHPTYMIVIDSL